jgi:hypothetical protein
MVAMTRAKRREEKKKERDERDRRNLIRHSSLVVIPNIIFVT